MNVFDISQSFINDKLSLLNGELLKPEYRKLWSIEKPTTGYCYILSEAIYHYCNGTFEIYYIKVNNQTHWYLMQQNNIIDFTANQFDCYIDYSKGKHIGFLKGKYKTDKGYISARGKALAEFLEFM